MGTHVAAAEHTAAAQTAAGAAAQPDSPTRTGLLIIGASQSGVQLAVSLRALGFDEHITLLGDEDHRPYQRPALSKEFLQGTVESESLIFRSNDYWAEHNVELVKGEYIVRIDKEADGSGVAHASSGKQFPFKRLALTVGARARKLEIDGGDLDGVLYLRNADDALALKARVGDAHGRRGDRRRVHRPRSRVQPAEDGQERHRAGIRPAAGGPRRRRGNRRVLPAGPPRPRPGHPAQHERQTLHRGGTAPRVTAAAVAGVELQDGTVLPAQIVLVGIGVIPNTQLAEQLGLTVDNGIVVDRFALASDGTTVAIGDCANMPNPVPGSEPGERIRLESVNNAIEHAKVAAYSLTGRREEYAGIPWFWSNQADLKLQIAGLCNGYDRTVLRRDEERGKFSVLYYRQGQVIAADCVNAPLDFMAVKNALAKGQNIPADAAADPATPLKTITTDS